MTDDLEQMLEEIIDHQNNNEFFPGLEKAKLFAQKYPDHIKGQKALGISYYQVNHYGKSAKIFEKVVPLFQGEDLAEAYFYLGLTQKGRGLMKEAVQSFVNGMGADPSFIACYTSLAEMLIQNNGIEDAQKVIQKGLDYANRENVYATEFHAWMGHILAAKGEYGKAVRAFRLAAQDYVGENQDNEEFDEEDNPYLSLLEDARMAAEIIGDELPEDEQVTDWEGPFDSPGTGNLTVNIEREFFEAILSGEKTIEYRSASDFWIKRVKKAGRPPFLMRVINGMSPTAPELTIQVQSIKHDKINQVLQFHLGKVQSVVNHSGST